MPPAGAGVKAGAGGVMTLTIIALIAFASGVVTGWLTFILGIVFVARALP